MEVELGMGRFVWMWFCVSATRFGQLGSGAGCGMDALSGVKCGLLMHQGYGYCALIRHQRGCKEGDGGSKWAGRRHGLPRGSETGGNTVRSSLTLLVRAAGSRDRFPEDSVYNSVVLRAPLPLFVTCHLSLVTCGIAYPTCSDPVGLCRMSDTIR